MGEIQKVERENSKEEYLQSYCCIGGTVFDLTVLRALR